VQKIPQINFHKYQEKAISFLLGQGCGGLFLSPGLGKSPITLEVIAELLDKKKIRKTLIIAPLRVVYSTWPTEIKKWLDFEDLTYTILHGTQKDKNLEKDVDIYLMNPDGLSWLIRTLDPTGKKKEIEHKFDMLVIDESSQFKHTNTARFKLLKKILNDFRRKTILTGSPVANGYLGIFGQIYILDQGLSLGRYITHFKNKYFTPSGYEGYTWTIQPDGEGRILKAIEPYVMHMSAEDFLEMPELIYVDRKVDLPPAAMKIYQEVKKELISSIGEEDLVAGSASVASMKCRQIANGGVYLVSGDVESVRHIHDEKTKELRSLIDELEGSPALVAYEFKHDLARIRKEFGEDIPHIGSGVSPKDTMQIVDDWNAGKISVLVCHGKSMAHGLNMQQSGNAVIFYSIPWDLETYEQLIRRVYRQGQKNRVFVYHIAARNTVDTTILRSLKEKDNTQKGFLNWLKEEIEE